MFNPLGSLLVNRTCTIAVLRSAGPDRWGDVTASVEHTITGCLVYPRASAETSDNSSSVLTGREVLAPAGADVRPTDRVRLPDGTVWNVVGEVGDWQVGCQFAIERATG